SKRRLPASGLPYGHTTYNRQLQARISPSSDAGSPRRSPGPKTSFSSIQSHTCVPSVGHGFLSTGTISTLIQPPQVSPLGQHDAAFRFSLPPVWTAACSPPPRPFRSPTGADCGRPATTRSAPPVTLSPP